MGMSAVLNYDFRNIFQSVPGVPRAEKRHTLLYEILLSKVVAFGSSRGVDII